MSTKSLGATLGRAVKEAKSERVRARGGKERSGNAGLPPKREIDLHHIDRGTPTAPSLKVRFSLVEGGQQEIDFGFAKPFGLLSEQFAHAFWTWGRSLEPTTRLETANLLRRGIFKYLKAHKPDATLSDFDEEFITSFIKWLDSKSSYTKNTVTHPTTRRAVLSSIRKMVQSLTNHPIWGDTAKKVMEAFPERQYPLAEKKSTPRRRLSREHLEAVDAAAQSDVVEIRARIARGIELLDEGRNAIGHGERDYSNLAIQLAEITNRYPEALPNYKQLKAEAPDLYEWAYKSNKRNKGFGLVLLGSFLYASPRDLVPFVILLAIEGGFNAEALLDLDLSEVAAVERMGVPAIRVSPTKRRGKKSPVKYLDPHWVLPWFEALDQLTKRLRAMLPPKERRRIFVYAQKWGGARVPRILGGPLRRAHGPQWGQALRTFIKDHKLRPFALSQIRPTEADEIGQAHGSLVASQAMNHASFNTTEASYLSSGTRTREAEQLSLIVDQMKRWVDSKGVIDTRRSSRSPSMDKGAATPGYECPDPYDSPRPGQRSGYLCGAYGECPSCPLASADHENPLSVAYYVALQGAILSGQDNMSGEAWMTKWAQVLADLRGQIDRIEDAVLIKAQRFKVSLPAVG